MSIVLLALWTRRGGEPIAVTGDPTDIHSLRDMQPAPRATVANIFRTHDLDFVGEAAPELGDEFLRERKRLALLWVLQTRTRATRLMRLHRITVRGQAELQAGTELRLAANYWQLLFLCGVLQLAINARGPFKTQAMARFVTESANNFWEASDRILSGLKGGIPRQDLRYLNH